MKIRKKLPAISLIMMVMILTEAIPFGATSISDLQKQKQEIEQQKEDAQKQQKEQQGKLSGVNGNISGIEDQQDLIAGEMDEIDEELVELIASVDMIKQEIEDKEAQLVITTADYEEALATEQAQYDAMKIRIKFMYEKGDITYLQLLMESQSIGDMVNKAEYIEKLYEYDRRLLTEYEETTEKTAELKEQLEEEKAALTAQQGELEEEQEELQVIMDEKQAEFDDFEAQLDAAKAEAAVYAANIKAQNAKIAQLNQDAATKDKEIQAAQAALEAAQAASVSSGSSSTSTGASTTAASGGSKSYNSAASYSGSGSKGQQIASYACQFIGNPYVPGGTSLTDGADCSGFVWRIYQDFGYSIPRTSYSIRDTGTAVDYANAQPGDIFCYAGHVGLYIGNGQIVHASTQKTGIKITNANYREIICIRRVA